MSLFELLLAVVGAAIVVLLTVAIALLLEMRDSLSALLMRESERRHWMRQEHGDG